MLQFPWHNMTGRRYSQHRETDLVYIRLFQALIFRGLSLCRAYQYFVVVYTCWIRAHTVNCTNLRPLKHHFVWKFPHVGKKNTPTKACFLGRSLGLFALCVCVPLNNNCVLFFLNAFHWLPCH